MRVTRKKQDSIDSALFALEVARHGRRTAAAFGQVQIREVGLIRAVLEFANPPRDGGVNRQEVARRVAGWLAQMFDNRLNPAALNRLKRDLFPALSAEAKQVSVIPVFDIEGNRLTVSHVVDGGRQVAMIFYGLLLLLDDSRPYRKRLGRCRVCNRFFLLEPRPGHPERTYCRPEHRRIGQNQDTLDRVTAKRLGMNLKDYRKARSTAERMGITVREFLAKHPAKGRRK